jgi:hypothetical protein
MPGSRNVLQLTPSSAFWCPTAKCVTGLARDATGSGNSKSAGCMKMYGIEKSSKRIIGKLDRGMRLTDLRIVESACTA